MIYRKQPFDEVIIDYTKYGKKIPKEKYLVSGKYPVIDQGQNQIAGYVNDSDGLYQDIPAIIFGDHTRKIKYIDTPFFLGADGVKLLKSRNTNVYYKYIYYYLLSAQIPDTGYNRHYKWLKKLQIPLPPLEEQKRIAAMLDKAQSLIDLRKKQISKMDELAQSVFFNMFGDPVRNEKGWEIVDFPSTAIIDTKMTNDFARYADYIHVGIENIERDSGKIVNCKTVAQSELISGKYYFSSKHIIYSKIRPNLNKVALPECEGLCSADAYPILAKNNTTREYLAFILRSDAFLKYILSHSDRTNIPKVNKEQLNGFCYMHPPIKKQTDFSIFIIELSEKKNQFLQGLALLQLNYNALMQQAFS